MIRRRIGALLVASALALGACQTQSESTEQASTSENAAAVDEATGASPPGDLLPGTSTGEEPTTSQGDGRPAEPTDPQPDEQATLGADGIPACDLLDLPATALDTIEDIESGGPYEFPRNDGVRFQNREGILPDEERDYYREFTVVTPNLDHRGARRIVTGGPTETNPDHWYYTGDHYESFCEFDPAR